MLPSNVDHISRLLCGGHSMQQPSASTASTSNSAGPDEQQDIYTLQSALDETALLEHFFNKTFASLGFSQSMSATACLDLANHAPYLRLQLLAISASHLSFSQPTQKSVFAKQANALRGAALSSYVSVALELDSATAPALLLFASLLAAQKLLDASSSARGDHETLFQHLLSYMDVQRGARLIAHRSWTFLRQSPLGPALEEAQTLPEVCERDLDECETLSTMVDSAHLSQDSTRVCREAIASLQWCFNVERTSPQGTRAAFAWPSLLSTDFMDLLRTQTPEALVILSFYGRLLHRHRSVWYVNNVGQRLVECVSARLGASWYLWLRWPQEVIALSAML